MAEDIAKLVEGDMVSVSPERILASSERERAMKTVIHMFLRLWTRFALESGQRLDMAPSQYSVGNYEGKMQWMLNETFNFPNLFVVELGARYGRKHALVGELYDQKGEERVRLVFSLEEEEVKGRPVSVNYLVYDSPVGGFKLSSAVGALKPALPKWYATVMTKQDAPLWDFCKDQLECVGV